MPVLNFHISGNTDLPDIVVAYSGTASGSVVSDGSGNYTIGGLTNGTYTVTPAAPDFYSFNPSDRVVVLAGVDVTGVNFTAIPNTWTISGSVGAAGATISYSGTASGSTIADGGGNYSIAGLSNGSYHLVPSLSGFVFSPTSADVTIDDADATQNFSASQPTYSISGTVSGAVQSGVLMTLSVSVGSPQSTVSASDGTYSFTGIIETAFPLTVAASLNGFTFAPASYSFAVAANESDVNFTSTAVVVNPGHGYLPLPFSQRTTAAVALFPCIAISGPNGAQMLAFGNDATINALKNSHVDILEAYRILRRQDVPNQRAKLIASVNRAVTVVAGLNSILQGMTASGDGALRLAICQGVAAHALTQISNVQFDEQT